MSSRTPSPKPVSVDVQTPPDRRPGRLVSLDAFRGFTMFWIVGGTSLALALRGLSSSLAGFFAYQLTHSPWEGLRYYDIIWPSFMLMVGMSIPFSFARRRLTQSRELLIAHVVRRSVILFLLGSLRGSVLDGRPELIELSSALQPIAIAYFLAAFLALYVPSPKAQAAVGAAILAAHGLLLAFVPGPDGSYVQGRNLVTMVDLAVLGRTHPEGWGTVLTAFPPAATTILGLLLGRVLLSSVAGRKKLLTVTLAGLGCLAAGYALTPWIPVIMKLWTTTYGLVSAGWSCLLFALFFWIIEVRAYKKWAFPFAVIGMNAIAIYLGVVLVPVDRIVGIFTAPLAAALGASGPLLEASAVIAVEWLILYWMYQRKIFLRV